MVEMIPLSIQGKKQNSKGNTEIIFIQLQASDQCFGHRASCLVGAKPVVQENGWEQPVPAAARAPSA